MGQGPPQGMSRRPNYPDIISKLTKIRKAAIANIDDVLKRFQPEFDCKQDCATKLAFLTTEYPKVQEAYYSALFYKKTYAFLTKDLCLDEVIAELKLFDSDIKECITALARMAEWEEKQRNPAAAEEEGKDPKL